MSTTERSVEPSSSSTEPRRIIIGVDGSPASIRALRWAARVGEALGIPLHAITAWEYPVNYGAPSVGLGDWRPDVDAANSLIEALKDAFGEHQPIDLQTNVVQGYPAKVMLDAGDGAEMLVLGSRGHGGFVGLLLGSVSAHCAELATCPVVVLHDKSDDR